MKNQPRIVYVFFTFLAIAFLGFSAQMISPAGTPIWVNNVTSLIGLIAIPGAIITFFIMTRPPKQPK